MPEDRIICEGWLAQYRQHSWSLRWAMLIQGDSWAGKAVLVLCDSFENREVINVLSSDSKTTPFVTNADPPMSASAYATLRQVRCCEHTSFARALAPLALRKCVGLKAARHSLRPGRHPDPPSPPQVARESCFGLGSKSSGKGLLFRTTSPSDMRRWRTVSCCMARN